MQPYFMSIYVDLPHLKFISGAQRQSIGVWHNQSLERATLTMLVFVFFVRSIHQHRDFGIPRNIVNCILKHKHLVTATNSQCPTRTTFPDNSRDDGDRKAKHFPQIERDSFSLAEIGRELPSYKEFSLITRRNIVSRKFILVRYNSRVQSAKDGETTYLTQFFSFDTGIGTRSINKR